MATEATAKKIIPLKPQSTEDELKKKINEKYHESNAMLKIVQEAVLNLTNKYRKQLDELIGFANEKLCLKETVDPESGKKQYDMEFNLTNQELEFLAIKIPTICIYLQDFVNERALDAALAEHFANEAITESLKQVINSEYKGDAKERLRFAEQQAEIEKIVSIIKKQVYMNMKSYIERADKIYEGVKKVLDGRKEERKLTSKYSQFNA